MDEHIGGSKSLELNTGMASAGLLADGKHLGTRGREEASNFRDQYNAPVTTQVLDSC